MSRLIDKINVTLIPPGYELYPRGEDSDGYLSEAGIVFSGKKGLYKMKVTRFNPMRHVTKYRMFVFPSSTDPSRKNPITTVFDNAQDAWDAGIALVLLGVTESDGAQ